MPVFQQLVNFDILRQQLTEPPVIVNDLLNDSEEEREKIRDIISSRYTTGMISLVPSCRCGETKSETAIQMKCPKCGTLVRSTLEAEIEPTVWYRKPTGIASLISPIVITMIKTRLRKRGFNVFQWLIDTSYNPNTKKPALVTEIQKRGIKRGYNNFVTNFDEIMAQLLTIRELQVKRNEVDYMMELITTKRDSIFTDYLPLPNKSLLVIEPNNTGVWVDPTIVEAINAIEMLISIDRDFEGQAMSRYKENRLAKAVLSLAEVYEGMISGIISGKGGLIRRHMMGTRVNFSFRGVITSITDPHSYNELHIPWGAACGVFRPMIVNKLMRRGYDLNSAIGLIFGHVHKYHPLLDEIFKELIHEAKGHRIINITQRNPSLLPGSALRTGITKVKIDPKDTTISTSILTVISMNADYDGDALNFMLSLDNFMADAWYPLEPHFTIMEFTDPFENSGNMAKPKPVISSISNWMNKG